MFEQFWKAYPHCKTPRRSKRAVTRAIFEQITGPGRRTRVDGVTLNLRVSAEVIIRAAKAYAAEVDGDYETPTTEARQYVPGTQVWLNAARWEDFEIEAEVIKLHTAG